MVAFGVFIAMREYASLESRPDLDATVMVGLFAPSLLVVCLGLYFVLTTGKR